VVLSPVAPLRVEDRPVEEFCEGRPERVVAPSVVEKPWLSRRGRRIDFARRDALNRRLGHLGEEFAVEVERRRMLFHGRDDLAAKVEWPDVTCVDGVGFDLLSFDEADDGERVEGHKSPNL
jgi:hypothetical protein